MAEEKYPDDTKPKIDLDVSYVKQIREKKCLVRWKDSILSHDKWASYFDYNREAEIVYRDGDMVCVVWKDSWIDLTRELIDLFYNQRF